MGILSSKKDITIYIAGLPNSEYDITRLKLNPESRKSLQSNHTIYLRENYRNYSIEFIENSLIYNLKESKIKFDALIYVVESSNIDNNINEAVNYLQNILSYQNFNEKSPVLIIGQCRKSEKSLSETEIIEKMKLNEIVGRDMKLTMHVINDNDDKDYSKDLDWIIDRLI